MPWPGRFCHPPCPSLPLAEQPPLFSPSRNPRSTMNFRRSRGGSGRSSGSAELWGSSDLYRSWERPQKPQENAPRSATSAGGTRGRWRNGEGGTPAQGIPGAPCPAPAVRGHSRRCWAFPARDAAVSGDPASARRAVTGLLSLPPHARTATLSVSPSLYCYSPALAPLPGGARLPSADLVPRCRRSLRDRLLPAPFPGPALAV